MTDTSVKLNGKPVGPINQGGYNRFHNVLTDPGTYGQHAIEFGKENEVEVLVTKKSSNASLEAARFPDDLSVPGIPHRPEGTLSVSLTLHVHLGYCVDPDSVVQHACARAAGKAIFTLTNADCLCLRTTEPGAMPAKPMIASPTRFIPPSTQPSTSSVAAPGVNPPVQRNT